MQRNMPCIAADRVTHTDARMHRHCSLVGETQKWVSVKSWGERLCICRHTVWKSPALMCDFLLAAHRCLWVTDEESPSAEGVPLLTDCPMFSGHPRNTTSDCLTLIADDCSPEAARSGWPSFSSTLQWMRSSVSALFISTDQISDDGWVQTDCGKTHLFCKDDLIPVVFVELVPVRQQSVDVVSCVAVSLEVPRWDPLLFYPQLEEENSDKSLILPSFIFQIMLTLNS